MTKITKGYKAMNSDLTCRDFKFKVGETYQTDTVAMCSQGFHFCENPFDVYNYYPKSKDTVICEVEALGEVLKEGDKSATNKIKIVKQLSDKELLDLWINRTNSGYWNNGDGNSGDRNNGNWNNGDGNSGDRNNGNWNNGDRNNGDGNSGYGNNGDRNNGNWNSGYGNNGNRNSGDWNNGDGNNGYFNTTIPIYMFNKPTDFKYTKEFENRIRSLKVKPILEWVPESLMNDKEKSDYPSHKTTGGYLRKTDRHDFKGLTDEDKTFIKTLPGFDNEVFKVISNGVSLLDDTVDIIVNGITRTISKAQAKALGLID